ncbi:MAG: organic solvent tolerance protein OstA [Selenomonadaceae bacterium]|nr:organic solvent tolerance protein OstA [Selenomonadaceae bacterium]
MKKQAVKPIAKRALLTVGVLAALMTGVTFAADGPAELDADTVEYDMNSGQITASGNVLMKQGTSRVAGQNAAYNTKTGQGTVTGHVIAERGDMRMTCSTLTVDGSDHYIASGEVSGSRGDQSFSASQVEYFPSKQYVSMPSGGTISSAEGTFTADQLQGWLGESHYVGTGNAHIVSPPRDIEAGGDQFDYYGAGTGKAVLTGNAWAYQGNNTMHSNRLTIYLASDGQARVQ